VKFIADTSSFLWFITDSERLSPKAKQILESSESARFLSLASVWEISIKASIGKLTFTIPIEEFLPQQLLLNQFSLLPISLAHTLRVTKLPFHHRDPFDRLIVAQSLIEGIPILSSDVALDAYGVERLW
jgi:PIN domain nuclease of toxin-antitoxin system